MITGVGPMTIPGTEIRMVVRLNGAEGTLICCDLTQWSFDGTRVHSANRSMGMFGAGLWVVDAATGTVTTLLTSNYDTRSFNYADSPYLAPDGYLYYFFLSSSTEEMSRVPLQLVRSAPDGASERTVLRPESFPLTTSVPGARKPRNSRPR